MNRDLYRLIKGLRKLSAQDVARVQAFINQLRAAELRELPADLKAVPAALATATATADATIDPTAMDPTAIDPTAIDPTAIDAAATDAAAAADPAPATASAGAARPEPGAALRPFWRRRAFQDIADDDLRPIADLFRAANESRASARQRFGAH